MLRMTILKCALMAGLNSRPFRAMLLMVGVAVVFVWDASCGCTGGYSFGPGVGGDGGVVATFHRDAVWYGADEGAEVAADTLVFVDAGNAVEGRGVGAEFAQAVEV